MLTVIRCMAEAVSERRAQWQRERLDPDATADEQNALLAEMLATALFAGEEAVRHTPEQLDVLAEAGVVDAGALGLVVIIRGMISGLAGEQVQLPEIPHYAAARLDQVHTRTPRFGTAPTSSSPATASTATRSSPGSSSSAIRCSSSATRRRSRSTCTPTIPAPQGAVRRDGEVTHEDIADMHEQVAGQRARLAADRSGVVAVASGDGMRSLFRGLGAVVVDGGRR